MSDKWDDLIIFKGGKRWVSSRIIGTNDNGFSLTFNSVTDAAKSLKLDNSAISKCLYNSHLTHGGYLWTRG
jgi:hypothetical protein